MAERLIVGPDGTAQGKLMSECEVKGVDGLVVNVLHRARQYLYNTTLRTEKAMRVRKLFEGAHVGGGPYNRREFGYTQACSVCSMQNGHRI